MTIIRSLVRRIRGWLARRDFNQVIEVAELHEVPGSGPQQATDEWHVVQIDVENYGAFRLPFRIC